MRYVAKDTRVLDTEFKTYTAGTVVVKCRCANSKDAEEIAEALNKKDARTQELEKELAKLQSIVDNYRYPPLKG